MCHQGARHFKAQWMRDGKELGTPVAKLKKNNDSSLNFYIMLFIFLYQVMKYVQLHKNVPQGITMKQAKQVRYPLYKMKKLKQVGGKPYKWQNESQTQASIDLNQMKVILCIVGNSYQNQYFLKFLFISFFFPFLQVRFQST